MNPETATKITENHLNRKAYIYIRQSSPRQIVHHTEGRIRQYDLQEYAKRLGWSSEKTIVIDSDQGKTGANPNSREGFEGLVKAVANGEVGIIIVLEASRLARNSPDWHNIIYMCRWSHTLIADESTIYDTADQSDRMILGIRGQMAELELETSIDRMIKARWRKAARGEFLTIPPPGYDIDELGHLIKSRDEAVRHAINTIFAKFDELGVARQVFIWWRDQGLSFPIRRRIRHNQGVIWVKPRYAAILRVLRHPVYAGVYEFGRTKMEKQLDTKSSNGRVKKKLIKRDKPEIFLKDHHEPYISYDKFLENKLRLEGNATMKKTGSNVPGVAKKGACLLQGLVICGKCGRPMNVSYGGHKSKKGTRVYQYRCFGRRHQTGDSECQTIGGKRIDAIVVETFIKVTRPSAYGAMKEAIDMQQKKNASLKKYWDLQIEKAEYEAERAFRQYNSTEPENRLVARTLEKNWEEKLAELEHVKEKAKAIGKDVDCLSPKDVARIKDLSHNFDTIWKSKTTSNADRKRLLRSLIDEVQLKSLDDHYSVIIVWKGGSVTEKSVPRLRAGHVNATSEDDIELVRKLAIEFDDAQIARTLNKQGRRSGRGLPYTKSSVISMRGRYKIPARKKRVSKDPISGPFTADEAAKELGVGMSTIQRWLKDGLLVGEQITPGAPWKIFLDKDTRKRLVGGEAPDGWLSLTAAAKHLGTSKGHIAYLLKKGKIDAVRTTIGKRTYWKIDVLSYSSSRMAGLFDQMNSEPI